MKTTLFRTCILLACGLTLAAALSGCAWSVGGGKEHVTTSSQPTRGQELIDLKKARDQGAISEQEYESQKTRILGH